MSDKDEPTPAGDQDTPPWLQAVSEEEEAAAAAANPMAGRTMVMIAAGSLAVVAVFVAAIFILYDGDGEEPVHVAAPDIPVREKPEDPGGLEVPHQDKEVFNRGAGQDVASDATLAPAAERPVDEIPDTSASDEAAGSSSQPAPAREEDAAAPSGDDQDKSDSAIDSSNVTDSVGDVDAKTATEDASASAVTGPVFRVQLGAYGSETGAERAWRMLSGRYPDELGGLEPEYQAYDTGDRTLVRLRVGPLVDQASADAVCVSLKAKGQGCLVIKP